MRFRALDHNCDCDTLPPSVQLGIVRWIVDPFDVPLKQKAFEDKKRTLSTWWRVQADQKHSEIGKLKRN